MKYIKSIKALSKLYLASLIFISISFDSQSQNVKTPQYVIRPYKVPIDNFSFIGKIDYLRFYNLESDMGNTYFSSSDRDLIKTTLPSGYRFKVLKESFKFINNFQERKIFNGIEINNKIKSFLDEDSDGPPLKNKGTIVLGAYFILRFDIDKGQTVDQIDSVYYKQKPLFIDNFKEAIELFKTNKLPLLEVNGSASETHTLESGLADNILLSINRTIAGINFFVKLYKEVENINLDINAQLNASGTGIQLTGADKNRILPRFLGVTDTDNNPNDFINTDQAIIFIFR